MNKNSKIIDQIKKRKNIILSIISVIVFFLILYSEEPYRNIGKIVKKVEEGTSFEYYNYSGDDFEDIYINRDDYGNIYFKVQSALNDNSSYDLYIINDKKTLYVNNKKVNNATTVEKYYLKMEEEYANMIKHLNDKRSGIHLFKSTSKKNNFDTQSLVWYDLYNTEWKQYKWSINNESTYYTEEYEIVPGIIDSIKAFFDPFVNILGGSLDYETGSTLDEFSITTRYSDRITLPKEVESE